MRYTFLLGLEAATVLAGPACLRHPQGLCSAPHGNGKCTSTSSCKGSGIVGYCPGDSSIQSCIDSGSSGSSSPPAERSSSAKGMPSQTDEAIALVGATASTTMETKKTPAKDGKETSTPKEETTTTKKETTTTGAFTTTEKKATTIHKTTSPAPKAGDGGGNFNEDTVQLIECEEGWSSTWYTIDGDKTIGYGHDCTQKGDCSSIQAPLSESEGEDLMKKDLEGFESCVCDRKHASELNIHQFGALISFAYKSCCGGVEDYCGSYMDKKDFDGICKDLSDINNLSGELSSQRKKEDDICKKSSDEKSGF